MIDVKKLLKEENDRQAKQIKKDNKYVEKAYTKLENDVKMNKRTLTELQNIKHDNYNNLTVENQRKIRLLIGILENVAKLGW